MTPLLELAQLLQAPQEEVVVTGMAGGVKYHAILIKYQLKQSPAVL
jgi:hypothetical protein